MNRQKFFSPLFAQMSFLPLLLVGASQFSIALLIAPIIFFVLVGVKFWFITLTQRFSIDNKFFLLIILIFIHSWLAYLAIGFFFPLFSLEMPLAIGLISFFALSVLTPILSPLKNATLLEALGDSSIISLLAALFLIGAAGIYEIVFHFYLTLPSQLGSVYLFTLNGQYLERPFWGMGILFGILVYAFAVQLYHWALLHNNSKTDGRA